MLRYLYYADAARAVDFLIDAFGFSEIEAVRDEDGNVGQPNSQPAMAWY